MRRKLVKQGINALTVTVPAKWAEKNGLKAGDEVEVGEEETKIIIYSGELKESKKKKIEIELKSNHEKSVKIALRILYRQGYSSIRLKYRQKELINTIKHVLRNNLIGLEVVRIENDFCDIDSITEPSSEKIDVLTKRIFYIIKDCYEILIEDIVATQKKGNDKIIERVESLDRYCNFCLRTLYMDKKKNNDYTTFVQLYSYFVVLGHTFLHLYDTTEFKEMNKISLRLVTIVKENFNNLTTGFFKNDIALIEEVSGNLSDIMYEELGSMFKEPMDLNQFHYIKELFRNSYLISSPCIGLSAIQGE